MSDKKNNEKEFRKILEEMGYDKAEDEPLTEQELRQVFIYNKIMEGEKNRLGVLTAKIDELSKTISEKKVYTTDKIKESTDKIKENPIAYVAGAFLGGILVGYIMSKGKDITEHIKGKDT
jgi:hypothetical protein